MEQELIKKIVSAVLSKIGTGFLGHENSRPIPIGVSNRHVHLSETDLAVLFGSGYALKHQKDLSQPGQFAGVETVILAGPKGCIEQVRVLGPVRKQTQVEISRGDSFKLGIKAPVRESGKLKGSCGLTIIGPKGTVQLAEGTITAQRHIHMTPRDAAAFGVADGQPVKVRAGEDRGLVFDRVVVRVSDQFALEFHIDLDEANAADISNGDPAYLLVPAGNQSWPEEKHITQKGMEMAVPATQKPLTLITEEIVRDAWKRNAQLVVGKNTLYTPLARDAMKELKVKAVQHAGSA